MNNVEPEHYNGWDIMEFIEKLELPFAEGSVIKYVCRWRKKGGVEDLKKARTYLDRMIMNEDNKIKDIVKDKKIREIEAHNEFIALVVPEKKEVK